jgi:hypothetical protein
VRDGLGVNVLWRVVTVCRNGDVKHRRWKTVRNGQASVCYARLNLDSECVEVGVAGWSTLNC